MSNASRRLLHVNVTTHPTAQWTLQQFRAALPADHNYRFVIHDRGAIFANQVDQSLKNMGLRVLKTPVRTPGANAICERVIGSLRRECLDFVIPLLDILVKTPEEITRAVATGDPFIVEVLTKGRVLYERAD